MPKIAEIQLFKIMKSRSCQAAFVISLAISYFLVPEKIFYGWYYLLGLSFMVLFALVVTCTVRNVKERIVAEKTYNGSTIGIIAAGIGLTALHACGLGNPVCGVGVGFAILTIILPSTVHYALTEYAPYLIALSLIFQLLSLHLLGCFKKISK